MAIIEIHGGPITHRYLMGKTKDELARLYMRLLQDTEQDAKDAEMYRWLRAKHNDRASAIAVTDDQFMLEDAHGVAEGEVDLDAAITAAMRAEGANT